VLGANTTEFSKVVWKQ